MKKIKALLVGAVLVLGFISAETQAQQGRITGKVTDKFTGKALVGANVIIKGTALGAAIGMEGNYKIENIRPGTYTIVASMMGYRKATKSIKVNANEITRTNFRLEEIAIEMKGVKVTAPGKVQTLRKAPMTITVIDASEIRGRAVSLNEVLTKATGVKIRREGGLGSADRIAIHGIEGKRIKVFLDGAPLDLPSGNLGINDIPIQLIERVEIYKGVVPARLGGDCIGGAVNIVLRELNSDYVDIAYTPGSYNTHRTLWLFRKVLDGPGIEFGTGGMFNYSDNDYLMESPFQPGLIIKRDHDTYLSYGAGIGLMLKKAWFDEIEIELETIGNRKEMQGVQKNIRFAETKSASYQLVLEMKKQGFFLDNLDFDYLICTPFFIGNFIDTSHYRYNWDGTKYPSPNGQGEVDWDPHDSKDKQYDIPQQLNLNYCINNIHSLNLNTVARYSSRHPDDSLAGAHAGYNVSEYPSEMYKITTGLAHEMSLLDGITVNSLSAKLFHINSKIAGTACMQRDLHGKPVTVKNSRTRFGISEAFRHRVFVPLIIKASCEHAVRLPDSRELFGDGVAITPAPKLKPEVSENANIGMIFDQKGVLGMPRLEVEINGFFRYMQDMIKLESGGHMFLAYVNLGEVRTMGVDGEIRADITRNIYAYTNATYQDLRDVRDYVAGTTTPNPTKDLRVPNVPYFYCNFGVELHKEDLFGQGRFGKVFWESSYVEEFFYAWEMSDYQKRRIPSSFLQTVGLVYSFMDDGLILSAEVHNLGDVKALDIYNRPRPGRTVSVNLRYSWFRGKIEGSKHRVF